MRATPTAIADVLMFKPRVFADERGFFFETFNERAFAQATDPTLMSPHMYHVYMD
jgi:dTDP-4-dehydrorhamnose 3,5-epimerase